MRERREADDDRQDGGPAVTCATGRRGHRDDGARRDGGRPDRPARHSDPSAPAGPPLPDGVAAVQGRYRMEYLDYSPSGYTLGGTYTGNEEQWNAETSCTGQSCTVNLRRALQSGGFKNYKLTSSAPKKYAGTFSAEADICEADPAITVKERVSIQTSRVADLGGTPTVTGLDV